MKLSALLLTLLVAACASSYAGPKRPWRIEVKTSGGFAGRGIGTYAVDSDGKVTAKLFDGRECTFTEDVTAIERILASGDPRRWKDSYVPEETCCDRIHYMLTFDEAGSRRITTWIDDPLPMPEDLAALAKAIVGGDGESIRNTAETRCARRGD